MRKSKLYAGERVRQARGRRVLTLSALARQLGISTSYLSQIENNRRPISEAVLMKILSALDIDKDALEPPDHHRIIADLREAVANASRGTGDVPLSEIRQVATIAPSFAREYISLQRLYATTFDRLRRLNDAVNIGSEVPRQPLAYEEVRDFFHYRDNYIHEIDSAAEALAFKLNLGVGGSLESRLSDLAFEFHGVRIEREPHPDLVRHFDPTNRTLRLNLAHSTETRAFQIAYLVGTLAMGATIEDVLGKSGFQTSEAVEICRIGLGNYAAGALVMPYGRFLTAAAAMRHDVETLALQFGVSIEQVCHRLSNLQRPGLRGVPLYFLRMDSAGNITKRHSATRFHFARYGGTCPLWNVHDAFAVPDRFLVQVAEMPDGVRYLSVARSIVKSSGSFTVPNRRYVLGFGCEIHHAGAFVYADAVDLKGAHTPIGTSCRICERLGCQQRAFPPIDRPIRIERSERTVVPFTISPVKK